MYTTTTYNGNNNNVRSRRSLFALIVLVTISSLTFGLVGHKRPTWSHIAPNSTRKSHLSLPASHKDPNLCKTLMSINILGYPTPTLVAWGEEHDAGHLIAGGSHISKVSGTLEMSNGFGPELDDDSVVMMDSLDVWLQLPPQVMIQRYDAIIRSENERLKTKNVQQSVVFGAGKRCAPNYQHTIACYPIPDSPLPEDSYGGNTDTTIGRTEWYSHRQRYLNSGFIMGPVADVRKSFDRTWQKMRDMPDNDEWENGLYAANNKYRGSDQAIFAIVFGEQEYQREVMRRAHSSRMSGARQTINLNGVQYEDLLNPPFTHQPMNVEPEKDYEFGITSDYYSALVQQTMHCEHDSRWIVRNGSMSIEEQTSADRNKFDCPIKPDYPLPDDLANVASPMARDSSGLGWKDLPLFTNICIGTIPVGIHHNSVDKSMLDWQWPSVWFQRDARSLLEKTSASNYDDDSSKGPRGARDTNGDYFTWQDLCPVDFDAELYRDVQQPEQI